MSDHPNRSCYDGGHVFPEYGYYYPCRKCGAKVIVGSNGAPDGE